MDTAENRAEPTSKGANTTAQNKPTSNESEHSSTSQPSRFRFKSSRSSHSRTDLNNVSSQRYLDNDQDSRHHRRRHHRRHHRSHHSKRRKIDNADGAATSDNWDRDGERELSPETAFRESLFDAMCDDEGALFWESVYGQPIHTYAIPSVPKGPDGELERMTDEEYTAYVRARMWERSHEGIMEERERQRREKAKAKSEQQREADRDRDRSRFNEALEESLRRGERRRRAKEWKSVWEKYLRSWEDLTALSSSAKTRTASTTTDKRPEARAEREFLIGNRIQWPVESGRRRDISREAIKEFMEHCPASFTSDSAQDLGAREDYLNTLKAERVRWHPDKMLHRYGNLGLKDEKALVRSITEVFQILDEMWIEEKERHLVAK